ncbi:phosphotransferase/anion transporter [Myxococcus stipitatus DSM 14675]|uniref:Phosphotransferase/anion transporter n=1 Tax=Myxococcus stipitatus (strain DSM 14675 / JCM 12634 / Mx s8) TaxID=1278073 RepID=L7UEB5_MYXSD|nr:contractile injection system tape measure protein [Myxococcus stipitatus]AGC47261.1 phosphotransferase/anion transporter [Myxococcus stipitatus DSM 14675]
MAPLPHRIRRQRWRVQTRTSEEAFAARQQVRDEMEGVLLPAFERAFDEVAPGDAVVHLPRLELHLRIAGTEGLAERLPELLYQQVREQLSQAVRRGAVGAVGGQAEAHGSVARGEGDTTGVPGPRDVAAGRGLEQVRQAGVGRGAVEGVSAERAEPLSTLGPAGLGQLRSHYLETGSLPWALAGLEREQVLETLRLEAPEALEHLRMRPGSRTGLDAGGVAFSFRLLQLLPIVQWAVIATGLAKGDWGAEVARAIVALSGEVTPALSRDARLLLASVLLSASRTGPEVASAEELVAHLVRAVGDSGGRTAEALTSRLPEVVGSLFRRWLALTEAPPRGEVGPRVLPPREALSGERSEPSPDRAHEQEAPRVAARPSGPGAEAEPFLLPVSHAGLLLLHPYLSRFFESTGVKEAKRPELPADTLPRAAALLHLLAVGEGEVHEFELDFIKLLLGLKPDAHLPVSSGLLQPSDHEEADALLQAVVEHWKALKNTSVQGLRGSFLRRRGFVREQEHGLLLRVESQAFDVLLGAIPWGIGTVKLPWMRQPIFTEWPTH